MADVRIRVNGHDGDGMSTLDRGLAYGDGLFETLRIEHGAAQHWPLHRDRLLSSCARLGIAGVDTAGIETDIAAMTPGVTLGVLKIVVTRGVGGRGYRPPVDNATKPTRIVQVHPYPDYDARNWTDGIALRTCTHRLPSHAALAGMKHLNRLDQVLARAEWSDPAIAEGLMLDYNDHVIAGTMSNVFFVIAGVLHTPDLAQSGIAGITRQRILAHAAHGGLVPRIGHYTLDDLLAADELFVCNSVIGVWPVSQLDGRPLKHGSVTAALAAACGGTVSEDVAVSP